MWLAFDNLSSNSSANNWKTYGIFSNGWKHLICMLRKYGSQREKHLFLKLYKEQQALLEEIRFCPSLVSSLARNQRTVLNFEKNDSSSKDQHSPNEVFLSRFPLLVYPVPRQNPTRSFFGMVRNDCSRVNYSLRKQKTFHEIATFASCSQQGVAGART